MRSLYLVLLSLWFIDQSFPQVPILFYDFESNSNRSIFENLVEQSINSGSGPIIRHGTGTIESGPGNDYYGTGLYGNNWQNTTSDPGTAATEYYQFTVNTTGFKGITLKLRYCIPFASGPGNFGILISSNGTNYKKTMSLNTGGPNSAWGDVTYTFYNYPEVNNNNNLTMRIYAFKGINSGSGGYLELDNLMIAADTILANAGNITLLNETNIYNCWYSGIVGKTLSRPNLIVNGPGTNVILSSPLNISQNLILNTGAAFNCGNFPIWGVGNFTLNSGANLYIGSELGISLSPDSSGNICLKGTRKYDSMANYFYNGTSSQITGNGLPATVRSLSINNSSGVTLINSIQVSDTLKLLSGNLILGNKNIVMSNTAFLSGGSSDSYIVTDNSGAMVYNGMIRAVDIKFPIGTQDSFNPVVLNYTGTIDTFKASVKSTFEHPPVDPNRVVNREWAITENNPGGSVASIKLFWLPGNESQGFNHTGIIMIGRFEGTMWNQLPSSLSGSGTLTDLYAASTSGVTLFSSFGIGNDCALPVELLSFDCKYMNNDIHLHWSTATEINSNSFDIEKKLCSDNNWSKIGNVKANFLSSSPRLYSFVDHHPNGGLYSYRLKMIDNNGSFKFSKQIEAIVNIPSGFELNQNFPNPFNPSTRINYKIPVESYVIIDIFNSLGIKITRLVNQSLGAGYYQLDFDPQRQKLLITSGVYYYKITAIEKISGMRHDIIKKMVYLK
jgi:hypothetical protein